MFGQLQRELEAEALEKAKTKKLIDDLTGKINEDWMLHLYRLGLAYTMGSTKTEDPWQSYSNIFLIYIYSVITSSQVLLEKVWQIYDNNQFIEELKKTPYWSQEELYIIKTNIVNCRTRFNVYDATMKQLFKIPLEETSWKKITEKFPLFYQITENQTTQLIDKIINPIFGIQDEYGNIYGFFKKVFTPPITAISCRINVTTGQKIDCKSYTITNFPYPEQNQYVAPSPDCIEPIVLWNELAKNIKFSVKLAESLPLFAKLFANMLNMSYGEAYAWGGSADAAKKWADEAFDDAAQTAKNAANAAAELAKQGADLGRSIAGFISNPPTSSNIVGSVLLLGVVGFGVYWISSEFLD